MTRKARTLSKITVEQEPGLADTLLTAELDNTHIPPSFAELGVREEIVRALGEIGIERTFAIQELTLPLALAGEDLIGQARTGMGKTFGFGVPLLHRIATADTGTTPLDGTPRALVIVPTRELCIQVTKDLENASKYLTNHQGSLKVAAIYGGRPYDTQIAALRDGVDVVVGTPGRLLDLANQNHLILGKIGVLVLDEADEMLDLGFLPDIERILSMVPDKRQTMLFSATMPGPIITLARTFLTRPTHIRAELANDSAVHDRTAQFVYRAHAMDKAELVARVLQAESRGATMIFTRTKRTAQKVADDLAERGFNVGAVHGDLGQIAREKALTKFRKGAIDVLVATDVAARGIDIDDVTHVINYQCPEDEKTYVHRIGRTGRAGRTGVAITLIDWDELHRWESINKALGLNMADPAETYSRSPHLYSDLGIPEGITGVIRKPAAPTRDDDAVVEERTERPKSSRSRRRTRGGKADAEGTESTTTTESADNADEAADGDKPARRRRRRRKPAEAGDAGTESTDAATAESGAASADVSDSAPADNEGDDTAKPARRRRRRKPAGTGAGGDTEAATTEPAVHATAGSVQ
ncbi:DEAD/DEAH box helicase [Nocardia sp. NPDC056952]|uniref:DEAD/DEAH box helicase n=1 Tax=Nocardia sp. NPDC056952 TaxID=3345979 RepID=UPI00363F3187